VLTIFFTLLTCQKMKCSFKIVFTASLDQTSRFKTWHGNSQASWMLTIRYFFVEVAASLADWKSPLNIMSRGGLNSSSNVLFLPLDDAPLLSTRNINANSNKDKIQAVKVYKTYWIHCWNFESHQIHFEPDFLELDCSALWLNNPHILVVSELPFSVVWEL